jgi:hypothetical protein
LRLPVDTHARLARYCWARELTITQVIESLIDQLLVQVDPEFDVPAYLSEAIAAGRFVLPDEGRPRARALVEYVTASGSRR